MKDKKPIVVAKAIALVQSQGIDQKILITAVKGALIVLLYVLFCA